MSALALLVVVALIGSCSGCTKPGRRKVARSYTSGPPPSYVVRHAGGAITIDGRDDEVDWRTAPSSPAFVDAQGSPETAGAASARLLWDDQYLYAFISVSDDDVYSEYVKDDDTLWKADAVELFIDADGNRRGYVELQVNPHNARFDSWFATTRSQPGDQTWSAGMSSAVTVRGTLSHGDRDEGWDVEIAIPLVAVKGRDTQMKAAIPPVVGTAWRLNVVRIDKPAESNRVTASSWSPITYRDFHALDRLFPATFGTVRGAIAPPAPTDGGDGRP